MSINAVRQAIKFDESDRVSRLAANFYHQHLRNIIDNENTTKDKTYAAFKQMILYHLFSTARD